MRRKALVVQVKNTVVYISHFTGGRDDSYSTFDGQKLADDVQKTCEEFVAEGFEIVSVSPIQTGANSWRDYKRGILGGSNGGEYYGYSITSAVLITGIKK